MKFCSQQSRKILLISIGLFIFLIRSNAVAQTPLLWGDLTTGPYKVGFQVVNKYDYARTFKPKRDYDGTVREGEQARPIQISIWYPAGGRDKRTPMAFGEYVFLMAKEESFGEMTVADQQRAKVLFKDSIKRWLKEEPSEEKTNELMKIRTACTRNAPSLKGSFPRIILAQGFSQSSLTHAILCEYLASYGYVVATSPSMGTAMREMTFDIKAAETQARDLEFLISYLHDFPNADQDKLGVAGFSFGGAPLAILPMRNLDVDAVLSLDSEIGFQGAAALLAQSPNYELAAMQAPLMHLTQRTNQFLDFSFIDSLGYSQRYILRFDGLEHFDFSSLGMITAMIPNFIKTARPNQKNGYEVQCRYALNFFNAYLKGDQQGLAYLKKPPEENHVSSDLLSIEAKGGQKTPPSVEQFIDIILSKGIERAAQIYREEKQRVPTHVLFKEETLNRLGYQFLYGMGMTKEALAIFQWNVEAYPNSFNVYDSIGEAYLQVGDKESAGKNYKKSLELNPNNTNASEVLKRLEGQ